MIFLAVSAAGGARKISAAGNIEKEIVMSGLNQKETTYTYNNAHMLESISVETGARYGWSFVPTGGQSEHYEYNLDGKLTQKLMKNLAGVNQHQTEYEYTRLGQLKKERYGTYSGGSFTGQSIVSYSYDSAGNRTQMEKNNYSSVQTTSYVYDRANRLTQKNNPNTYPHFYDYDASGNLLNVREGASSGPISRKYYYDSLNRTSRIEKFDWNFAVADYETYSYDEHDRRLSKSYRYNGLTAPSGIPECDYTFIWDGNRLIGDVAQTLTLPSNIKTEQTYEWGSNGLAATIKTVTGGTSPGGSSTIHSTNYKGDIIGDNAAQPAYDAFGRQAVTAEGLGFSGEYHDAWSGLQYLRARYYDPETARFTQEDTYYGDGPNLYAYCGNDPVNYVDRNGLWKEKSSGNQTTYTAEEGDTFAALGNMLYGDPTHFWWQAKADTTFDQSYFTSASDNNYLTPLKNGQTSITVNNNYDSAYQKQVEAGNHEYNNLITGSYKDNTAALAVLVIGNNVFIRAYLSFNSDAYTKAHFFFSDYTYAAYIIQGIRDYWNISFKGSYNVSTYVNALSGKTSRSGISVNMNLAMGTSRVETWLCDDTKKILSPGEMYIYWGDPRNNRFNVRATRSDFKWTAAHEFGHILGLDDAYNPITSNARKGITSIMNDINMKVQINDIRAVLWVAKTGIFNYWDESLNRFNY